MAPRDSTILTYYSNALIRVPTVNHRRPPIDKNPERAGLEDAGEIRCPEHGVRSWGLDEETEDGEMSAGKFEQDERNAVVPGEPGKGTKNDVEDHEGDQINDTVDCALRVVIYFACVVGEGG